MDSLLRWVSNFVNGYMGEVCLKGVSNFANGYLGEVCLKGVANFVNGYMSEVKFVKMLIQQWKNQKKKPVKYETK